MRDRRRRAKGLLGIPIPARRARKKRGSRDGTDATLPVGAFSIDAIQAIRRGKMEWEAAFDAVSELLVILDHEDRIVRCNRAAALKLGRSYDELRGRLFSDVFLGGDLNIDELLPAPRGDGDEGVYFPALDGWFSVEQHETRPVEGLPPGKVWVLTEITDRKALEAERRMLVEAMDNADEAMLIVGIDGELRYVNPAFRRVSGWHPDEARNPVEAFIDSCRDEDLEPFLEAIRRGCRWKGNFHQVDGEQPRELSAGVWPIRDAKDIVVGTVALMSDVTEQLAARQREERMKEMARMGWLVGGVAHEVRNPLNAIQAVIQALQLDLGSNADFAPLFDVALAQVAKLSTMMKDLLELGKPISNNTMKLVPFSSVCEQVLSMWRETHPAVPTDAVRFRAEGDSDALVLADRDRFGQVLVNLLDNALQASTSEVRVEVLVAAEDHECRLRVSDRGRGIANEHLDSVFEPFFTLRQSGTGLGLSIVRHVVEELGGTVTLQNRDGGAGCVAEVVLPRARRAKTHAPSLTSERVPEAWV